MRALLLGQRALVHARALRGKRRGAACLACNRLTINVSNYARIRDFGSQDRLDRPAARL